MNGDVPRFHTLIFPRQAGFPFESGRPDACCLWLDSFIIIAYAVGDVKEKVELGRNSTRMGFMMNLAAGPAKSS